MSTKMSADADATDDSFVVVTTTYPTTYGCHRGRTWSKVDMICQSDVDVSKQKYDSYAEAVEEARRMRGKSNWFEGYEPEDYGDWPPYCSAVMKNYDKDTEVLIRVMTESEFHEERAEDQEYVDRANEEAEFEAALKSEIIKLQVEESGERVFYSYLYRDCQIPAEFEFDESKKDSESSFALPANASEIKSVMFKVDGASSVNTKVLEGRDAALLQESDLVQLLVACTSLEELYLRSHKCQTVIGIKFIEGIATHAPHLCQTLKVLSISDLVLAPWTLKVVGKHFPNLTRLDLSDCFSTQYNGWMFGYDDDDEAPLPYDEPLLECVRDLPNLKRLDLGHGGEMRRYLFDYSLNHCTLLKVYRMVKLVTLDEDNMPEPFSSTARKKAAKAKALQKLGPKFAKFAKKEMDRYAS